MAEITATLLDFFALIGFMAQYSNILLSINCQMSSDFTAA